VTGRAKLECMVSMNYSAGQQINIDRPRPLLQWSSRRRCPQQVLNIVISTSRPRLAPAVTVGHSLHLTAAPGSPAPCRSLLAVAKSVSHLVPHWRPADDYNGSLYLTAAPGSNRSHSFMNSPLLITAIHCFDHSRVILFIVSRISVILLVSLPPQSKALSPFSNPLWTYAALHVSPLTKPLIAMHTFYCHWIKI